MEAKWGAPLRRPGEHGRPYRDQFTRDEGKWRRPSAQDILQAATSEPTGREAEIERLMTESGKTREEVHQILADTREAEMGGTP